MDATSVTALILLIGGAAALSEDLMIWWRNDPAERRASQPGVLR